MGVFQNISGTSTAQPASGGGGIFSQIVQKAQTPKITTSGIDISPANVQKARTQIPNAIKDVATGAAKGAIKGGVDLASIPTSLGGAIETGLDQTVGRIGNLVAGKGAVPTNTAAGPQKVTSALENFRNQPGLASKNTAEGVGNVIGQAADLLVGPPGSLAEKGTQAGVDLAKTGLETGAQKVGQIAENRAEGKLTEALTPRIVGKGYEKAGALGKLNEPTLFNSAGVAGDQLDTVKNAILSVKNVAGVLGKKVGDIVNTGSGQITKNVNRIRNTISEYSDKVVRPFIQKSGANYNFADLKKALEIAKPASELEGPERATYNKVRQRVLTAIADKVGPDVKNVRSLADMRSKAVDGVIPAKVLKGDEDFWDARKIIDSIVDEETKGKAFGSAELNGAKAAYRDMRGAFKQYLSEAYRYPGQMENVNKANDFLSTAQGRAMNKAGWNVADFEKKFGLKPSAENEAKAKEWEQHMQNLSGLYDAAKNIGTKLGTERGSTTIGAKLNAHPVLKGVLKKVGFGAAIGSGFLGIENL